MAHSSCGDFGQQGLDAKSLFDKLKQMPASKVLKVTP
jgi:hypothetical protein